MRRTGRTFLGAAVAAGLAAALLSGRPAAAQAPAKAPPPSPASARAKEPSPAGSPAAAKDAWKREFEDVCAKTQDAMSLTSDELRALIARCDKLKPAVDALDETERKVASRRLRECRNLYQFVLESRDGR
jgi:hypothetical protein